MCLSSMQCNHLEFLWETYSTQIVKLVVVQRYSECAYVGSNEMKGIYSAA